MTTTASPSRERQLQDHHFLAAIHEATYLAEHGVMEFRQPADNPMFDEVATWFTLFVRPPGDAKWTCPVCGKRRGKRWFWTQRIPFQASKDEAMSFCLQWSELLPAYTPVCGDHVLQPWFQGTDEPAED